MSNDSPEHALEPHTISLPDGDTLLPRKDFAKDILHVSDKTAMRMNLPTTLIGGKAYVARNASLKVVADKVRRPNQPEPPMPKPRARPAPPRAARSAHREQV
jgi:hypothetical protein